MKRMDRKAEFVRLKRNFIKLVDQKRTSLYLP